MKYGRLQICHNNVAKIRQIANLPEHKGKSEHEPLYVTAAPYVTADL